MISGKREFRGQFYRTTDNAAKNILHGNLGKQATIIGRARKYGAMYALYMKTISVYLRTTIS